MKVQKRDGRLEELNIENIRKQTIPACEGLAGTSYEDLELSAKIMFTDGIKTTDIQNSLIRTALNKIDIDAPKWTYVAARLRLYDLYHTIEREYGKSGSGDIYKKVTLLDYLTNYKDIFSYFINKYTEEEILELDKHIDSSRDLLMDYPGVITMIERYLAVKDSRIVELPQHLHMVVAMFVMQNEVDKISKVIELYNRTSKLELIMATPINSGGRIKGAGTASCLGTSMEDTLESIFDTAKEVAFGSKALSGWGIDASRIRALGSKLMQFKNVAGGVIPFLKIFNDIALAVNQGGRRAGAFNVTLESWHIDIFDFIDLRKKNGEDRRRAQDLFLTISMSDLFIERIKANSTWTLFDPHDCPELTELYGDEFKAKYEEYEAKFTQDPSKFNPYTRTIPVVELTVKILESYIKEGMPFIFFKDTVNKEHKYSKELGIIRHPNLCVTADTPLLTREYGNAPIGDLVKKGITKVHCWNGDEWSLTTIGKTADSAKVLTVEFSTGETIRATEMHKWYIDIDGSMVELRTVSLKPGMLICKYGLPDGTFVDNVRIKSVTDNNEYEATYCGTEPKRHMLMFNGILTGNCMEVFQPDDANSTFVCNLAALNLARLTDKENLIATSKLAIRALDNIIDVTTYSSDRAATRQKLTRSTGLGAVGEGERLATLNIYYGSKEHEQWLHDTYGTIKKAVDEATVELAKEKGGNEIDPSVRNLYRLAIAPNTASGLLAGTTASCEPVFDRLYVENSKVGTYKMVAPNIDISNVSHYRTAYEYDQADLIRMTGIRQKYIDMGISHSLYIDPTAEYKGKPFTPIALLKLILLAHKEGVKTLYYFRAKARKNSDTVSKGDTTVCENCAN